VVDNDICMRLWIDRLRPVLIVLGLVAMAWALKGAVDGIAEFGWPSWWIACGAIGLAAAGIYSAGTAWSQIVLGRHDYRLSHAFVGAQIGKYVPGGIWQAAGQIDVAVRRGVAPAEAGVMFAAFVVAFVASAGVVGGGLVLVDTTWWVRVGAATGLLGGSILLAGDFPSTIARRLPRLGASGDRVRVSWRAVLGFLGYFLGQGSAALVLTYGLTDQWVWPVGPAYAVAWAIGFLVAPVPAGVGIREAALLLLLSSSLVDDAVLAMSILLRAAAIAGELLVIVSGAVARRYVRTDAGMP